ncbi:unnamed protein product [Prunus brigantina]
MHIAELYVEDDGYVVTKTASVKALLFKLYGLYEACFVSNPTQSGSSCTSSMVSNQTQSSSSLSPAVVEALICTQNWLKSTSISLEVEPTIEEMEFYETIESEMKKSNAMGPLHVSYD